jgi:hypothetical protein
MGRITRFYQTTVGTSATQIVPYNPNRTALLIRNIAGSTVYVSTDQANIQSAGLQVGAAEYLSFAKSDGDAPELQVYALTDTGTADVRIVETVET